jgi:hypothetical protein
MKTVRGKRDFAASAGRAIGARSRLRRLELGEEAGRDWMTIYLLTASCVDLTMLNTLH